MRLQRPVRFSRETEKNMSGKGIRGRLKPKDEGGEGMGEGLGEELK